MNQSPEKRFAIVKGLQIAISGSPRFNARIEFEYRADCIYYTWTARSADGSFLAQVGRPVSLGVIPAAQDHFEFALAHATQNIRRYRIGRERQFQVDDAQWSMIDSLISTFNE